MRQRGLFRRFYELRRPRRRQIDKANYWRISYRLIHSGFNIPLQVIFDLRYFQHTTTLDHFVAAEYSTIACYII